MVAPRLRSRSLVKKRKTTPGGRRVVHYRKKPSAYARCAGCRRTLLGVPRKDVKKLTRSQRTPSRPYGGNLCSRCMRRVLKEKIRGQ
ncbi:MAG: 50S ribosomal protein L34e [Methanobacteriota archaeon]|nr:MAG: 50S ribosomal protein L34e [Euryarchaeota archaeon]